MHKHCLNVCKFCLCLVTESTNSAPMRTIMTTALQRQYLQTELIFWITLVLVRHQMQPLLVNEICHISSRDLRFDLISNLQAILIKYKPLTPCSRVLEMLTGHQLVKKLPSFYETHRFITTFSRACRLSLS